LKSFFSFFILASGLLLLSIPVLGSSVANPISIARFSHIYEASGVVSSPEGDILIVEDDGSNPLRVTQFKRGSDLKGKSLKTPVVLQLSTPVDDLEGVAVGKDETIFLITSFSVTKNKKKRKKKRQRLIQLKIRNGKIIRELHFDHLLTPIIQQLLKGQLVEKTTADTLNIEDITFDKNKKHLLIGLRSPLIGDKAIILVLENPYDIFSRAVKPRFSSLNITFSIGGEGIRGLTYDHSLDVYLIVNEIRNKKGKLRPALWVWKGNPAYQPTRVSLPKMKKVKNIEGITPVEVQNKTFFLLVCDDGNRKKGKGSHYILLGAEVLLEAVKSR